jgi:hypothetical protein
VEDFKNIIKHIGSGGFTGVQEGSVGFRRVPDPFFRKEGLDPFCTPFSPDSAEFKWV